MKLANTITQSSLIGWTNQIKWVSGIGVRDGEEFEFIIEFYRNREVVLKGCGALYHATVYLGIIMVHNTI